MNKNLKYCPDCKKTLPKDKFNKASSRADGLMSVCKECNKIRYNKWYDKNKNKVNDKRRQDYNSAKALVNRDNY